MSKSGFIALLRRPRHGRASGQIDRTGLDVALDRSKLGAVAPALGIRRRKSEPRLTALNGPVTTEGEPMAFAGATGTTKTPA
jgi:hypothetical protein